MQNPFFHSILPGIILFSLLCSIACATDLLITVQDSQSADLVPQANIYVDGTNVGQTTSGGTFLLSHENVTDFNMRIVKNGYGEWNGTISPDLAFLEITLSRLTRDLTVQVYDADSLFPVANATVILSFGTDTRTAMSDERGIVAFPISSDMHYTISISAQGYRTITSNVVGGKSEEVPVQYWLVRNDRISFSVTDDTGAAIEGATIYIDAERIGTTDNRGAFIHSIPRNNLYALEVKKEGYQEYREYRTIGEGEAVLEITLTRGPASESASLIISVIDREQKPIEGAGLSLNGKDIGFSDSRGQVITVVPYDSPVRITARKDGYSESSAETNVTAGDATPTLTMTLDRAPDWSIIAIILLGGVIILFIIVGISRRRRPARHIVRRNEI